MRAIETSYAGCRFRSRLEARWAVFFDTLGIEWEHEPQGFELQHATGEPPIRYLPDFRLPELELWVEVKGSQAMLNADTERMLWLLDYGSPIPRISESLGTRRGLLILGPVPRPVGLIQMFPLLQHHKGMWLASLVFSGAGDAAVGHGTGHVEHRDTWYASGGAPSEIPLPPVPMSWRAGHEQWARSVRCVDGALTAARSARFEHGQTPR